MFVLAVDWAEPKLPKLVGPFPSRGDADAWASLRIRNGEWSIESLGDPAMSLV